LDGLLETFYRRRFERSFPDFFYELCLDMFAIVQYWEPPVSGTARGRLFEKVLYQYCDSHRLQLTERAGGRTVRGKRAASGFLHESDAVITIPELTVHLELKHLTSELGKNELLIFNQKGLDFLAGGSRSLVRKPLYRIVLSGHLLSEAARRFAIQWGICVIEPDRLPFPVIHKLAGCSVDGLHGVDDEAQEEIWRTVPKLIASTQDRIRLLAEIIEGHCSPISDRQVERAIRRLQREWGDAYWMALDDLEAPNWLENRFDELEKELDLDRL